MLEKCVPKPYMADVGFFRPNVGMVLLNSEGLVFVGKRVCSSNRASWQMPQGGVMEGEPEPDAMFREMEEEVGLSRSNLEIVQTSKGYHSYIVPKKYRRVSSAQSGFVGQRQRWFCLRIKGGDEAINIRTPFPEFTEWTWMKPHLVLRGIISFKRQVYAGVLSEFGLVSGVDIPSTHHRVGTHPTSESSEGELTEIPNFIAP